MCTPMCWLEDANSAVAAAAEYDPVAESDLAELKCKLVTNHLLASSPVLPLVVPHL